MRLPRRCRVAKEAAARAEADLGWETRAENLAAVAGTAVAEKEPATADSGAPPAEGWKAANLAAAAMVAAATAVDLEVAMAAEATEVAVTAAVKEEAGSGEATVERVAVGERRPKDGHSQHS